MRARHALERIIERTNGCTQSTNGLVEGFRSDHAVVPPIKPRSNKMKMRRATRNTEKRPRYSPARSRRVAAMPKATRKRATAATSEWVPLLYKRRLKPESRVRTTPSRTRK